VSGTKVHFWIEAEHAQALGPEMEVDISYFDSLVHEAIKTLEKFGNVDDFVA
jgi:hypothetical protein